MKHRPPCLYRVYHFDPTVRHFAVRWVPAPHPAFWRWRCGPADLIVQQLRWLKLMMEV